jgi:hypothetical protein
MESTIATTGGGLGGRSWRSGRIHNLFNNQTNMTGDNDPLTTGFKTEGVQFFDDGKPLQLARHTPEMWEKIGNFLNKQSKKCTMFCKTVNCENCENLSN